MMQVVATAGHVDHGKSALVRALTGREPDRLAEERRRGLTIDLGYVWTDLVADGRAVTVAFVDVPGHDRFLTNMLAGVGAVDEVLFVVAADDGWSAQSEEHLEIVTLLGRRITAAVVTKTTPAGPARTSEVVAQVRERLARVGAGPVPVLAVDALDGVGLDELRTVLVQRLSPSPGSTDDVAEDGGGAAAAAASGVPDPPDGRFPRLWVDRVFSVAGAGTVVTGTLTSGRLRRGDQVAVLPGPGRGRIRDLRTLEVQVEEATAPARVAVALAGVDGDLLARGSALVGLRANGSPTGVVSDAMDVWLEALDHGVVGHRGAWQLHLGTAHHEARLLPLLGELQPGERGPARLEVAAPVPVRIGDRFVLREVGRRVTAAGGTVLEPSPSRTRRGVSERLEHAEALEAVRDAGTGGLRLGALVSLRGGASPLERLEAAFGQPLRVALEGDPQLAVVDEQVVEQRRFASGGRQQPWRRRASWVPTTRWSPTTSCSLRSPPTAVRDRCGRPCSAPSSPPARWRRSAGASCTATTSMPTWPAAAHVRNSCWRRWLVPTSPSSTPTRSSTSTACRASRSSRCSTPGSSCNATGCCSAPPPSNVPSTRSTPAQAPPALRSPPPTPARSGSSPAATPSPSSNTSAPPVAPPSTAPTTAV
jgi:selenocysteine-specific translation elongation factor